MFSALLNAQNRGPQTIPITSAVFEYSDNGDDWFPIPSPFPLGTSVIYDGGSYQFRVFSVSPAGATYTTSIPSPITNAGQTAQLSVSGTGIYTGTITSGIFQITQRTITATSSNFFEGAIQPDTCNVDGSVSGFNITLGNLVGATGVSVTIFYGTDYNSAVYCLVWNNTNEVGVVSGLIGTSPYQNVVYNTNGVKTFYTNYNNFPSYYWCAVNESSWEIAGETINNPFYNSNFSTAIVSNAGSPAPFNNSCGT